MEPWAISPGILGRGSEDLPGSVHRRSPLDLGHLLCTDPGRSSETLKAMKLRASHRVATESEVDDMSATDDDDDEVPTLAYGHDAENASNKPRTAACRRVGRTTLRGLLDKHLDVFRLGWKEDNTPVSV
jgi:hypothetical protein